MADPAWLPALKKLYIFCRRKQVKRYHEEENGLSSTQTVRNKCFALWQESSFKELLNFRISPEILALHTSIEKNFGMN